MLDALLQENRICIGVDLMGSDTAPLDLYEALKGFANIVFFTSEEVSKAIDPYLHVVKSRDVISMEDDPIQAIRRKKESSLCQGMRYLQEKKIDAFITAGNTGALLLSAKTTLDMLPGIDRPALLGLLPTKKQPIAVLDVGANLTVQPHHLLQFAAMGIAYQKSRGIEHPTVGLLNVGTEAKKGPSQLREAYLKLEKIEGFVGNIEGKAVFHGNVDVLVTDGFTGNIFLKTAEGVAAFILEQFSPIPHLTYEMANLRAILCGIDGIVVKCHGDTTPEAFVNGVKGAIRLVQHNFLEKIKNTL